MRRQVIYFLDSYFLLVSLMYTQSVKCHKYKHGFKCLREMGDVVPPQRNTEKVLCICGHLDMCSHYVFPLCSAVTGKASAKVFGRFNLWIIMQLCLTIATILLLVQVTHSNDFFLFPFLTRIMHKLWWMQTGHHSSLWTTEQMNCMPGYLI